MNKLYASDLRHIEDAVRDLSGEYPVEPQVEAVEAPDKPNVLDGAFPHQLAYINDPSPFKGVLCTRRAAKTYGVGLEMINDSFNYPYANYLFLGLVREVARDIFWKDVLKDIDRRYNLGAKFNESRLVMQMPNGAEIKIGAADSNEREREKFLGGKKRKICVDEAQSWKTDLEQLVMSVLKPSVADLRGSITLTGTPGDYVQGFFHRVTNGCRAGVLGDPTVRLPGWSLHTWTTWDNPYMRVQWEAEIADLVAQHGEIVRETPWFKQNYLGEWVIDLEARCYKFDLNKNVFDLLPVYTGKKGRWHYVLGIDIGYYPDPAGYVLCAYHDFDPCLYMLRTWKQWKMDITDMAEKAKEFQRQVLEETGDEIDTLIIDGANANAVAEMRKRHNLPLLAADKQGKSDFIELMNAEFLKGKIKLNVAGCQGGIPLVDPRAKRIESLALTDEYAGLIWDPRTKPPKREEHPGCANHLADCALYSWRHCYQYLSVIPTPPPEPGSPAWHRAEEERMRAQAEGEMLRRREADAPNPEEEGMPGSGNWDPNIQ